MRDRVEFAVGEGSQCEHRVGRATVPQIDFDGVGEPLAVAANHYEVDAEPTDDPLIGQPQSDLARPDRRSTTRNPRWRGNGSPRNSCPGGPSQDLIVGRQDLNLFQRTGSQLHARAVESLALDSLLDDPFARPELGQKLPREVSRSSGRSVLDSLPQVRREEAACLPTGRPHCPFRRPNHRA